MALTTAQQVRLRIQDTPTLYDATLYGDGLAQQFSLPQRNQTSATAFVPAGGTAWSGTGAAFDGTFGSVSFSGVISANSAFRVRYIYSVFSDDEIDTMITAGGGDVLGASVEAVQTLMFDAQKRAVWRAPDGSMYDDTAAQAALKALYDALIDQQERAAVTQGGLTSWSMNQQDY